jgi:hypothetical protein
LHAACADHKVEEVTLKNERLTVEGRMALARTEELDCCASVARHSGRSVTVDQVDT